MLKSIVNLCEKHGFLNKVVYPKLKIEQLKVGPTGSLLLQNLQNEWHNNVVINKDTSIFLSDDSSFQETFQFAKNMCIEKLPFGVAEIVKNKHYSSETELMAYYKEIMENEDVDFAKLFKADDLLALKCSVFTNSAEAIPYFHQWQRQRRIWWRKFSPNPGRYSITDIKTDENNVQSVQILAKYPWRSQVIETIVMYPKPKDIADKETFKEGKKVIKPSSIVSSVDVGTMFLNAICDAYDDSEYKGNRRTLMRFHRKLAPYRISFSISAAGVTNELRDLALYLTRQLRANHVSVLFVPSCYKYTLEAQYRQYDELGVPYTIVLNEKTLKDGIAYLRSRETTLKEQVHITELVSYVDQLFKNY